jgi:hypothetical protein
MVYQNEVAQERPLSEGDQIKAAIRELFCESRNGAVYTQEKPLRKLIGNVNGSGVTKTLCLFKHTDIPGALVMWYEDVE